MVFVYCVYICDALLIGGNKEYLLTYLHYARIHLEPCKAVVSESRWSAIYGTFIGIVEYSCFFNSSYKKLVCFLLLI